MSLGFVTGMLLQSALVFGFYTWSQHWLLAHRVSLRAVLPGALAIAIGTAITFRASREIIALQIVWQTHAYGAIGVVFVLSAWLMVLCMVIFGGAVIGALIPERRAHRQTATSSPVTSSTSSDAATPSGYGEVAAQFAAARL